MDFNLFKRFINLIYILKEQFLDLIYKRKCIECGCSINNGILCKNCLNDVQNLPCFAQTIINGFPVYSVFYYEKGIKSLVHKLKFHHNKICAYYAANYIYDYIKGIKDVDFNNAILIPIKTHKKNRYKRGYDNVFEICKELNKITKIPLFDNVLSKIKYTLPQYKINAKDRRKNIADSFCLDKNFKTDKLIIVFDDIITTGSTLDVVTSLFKERGFNNLICLTLCKTKNF